MLRLLLLQLKMLICQSRRRNPSVRSEGQSHLISSGPGAITAAEQTLEGTNCARETVNSTNKYI